MSALPCKLTAQIVFKAGGDTYHTLLTRNPEHCVKAAPNTILGCTLHQGTYGTVGSVLEWKFIHGGKEETLKQVIHNIDEEKKLISYKTIEGDLLQLYKNLIVTFHVETYSGVDYITWTVEYELVNADAPHLYNLLKATVDATLEVEAHIFG